MATDSHQRTYLQILRTTGKVPTDITRPDFNGLSETIDLIESIALESQGNQRVVESAVESLSRTNPKLAALAKDESKPVVEVISSEQLHPPLPEGMALPPGATDGLCPLKDEYVAYSSQASPEGYEEFHATCFWSMLSTVAARRVKIGVGKRQYTPLIAVLAARTSLYKKTVTAEVTRDVLKAAGLEWLLGLTKTTPQKLLSDMAGSVPENYGRMSLEQQILERQQLAMSGQRGWLYNEFGKLIKAMMRTTGPMADFIELLLIMDDCSDLLKTGTVGRGTEIIKMPYLSVLGTLTPASIKAVAGKNAELWSDGFFARIVFSCPPPNTYLDRPFDRSELTVPPYLAAGIRNWHNRLDSPEIDIIPVRDDEGKETKQYEKVWTKDLPERKYPVYDDAYTAWTNYRSALKQIIHQHFAHNQDFDGSYERLAIMALRVATLAASLEGASGVEYRHWMLGQEQAEMWRSSLHQLYAQINISDGEIGGVPTQEDMLVDYLKGLEKVTTAREILQYGPAQLRKLKSEGIRDMLAGLIKDGVVEKARIEGSKAEWYRYLPE